jgi:non-canonical (house-cleaning) NTP pyrophosphatase
MSSIKFNATRDGLTPIYWYNGRYVEEIKPCLARSGVPETPFGDLEILQGALNRAEAVAPHFEGWYVLAIENGVTTRSNALIDLAYGVVLDLNRQITVRMSEAIVIPSDLVTRAELLANRSITCGQLEANRTPGADPSDPHKVWSKGQTSRRRILARLVESTFRSMFLTETPR